MLPLVLWNSEVSYCLWFPVGHTCTRGCKFPCSVFSHQRHAVPSQVLGSCSLVGGSRWWACFSFLASFLLAVLFFRLMVLFLSAMWIKRNYKTNGLSFLFFNKSALKCLFRKRSLQCDEIILKYDFFTLHL